ncbi:hypothetical protein [Affinibrenneria salicis]|uniref:hypothetical protein n=1 Tax=Affinibrenneria salicis TaxID=2590031 RepID=UPI001CC34666|nr:hypothetical protein [Affinibrenneria salicis]
MHWSWKIDRRRVRPEDVPPMAGVNIQWVHQNADASIQAATARVNAYGMSRLHVAPALRSRHTEGHAIDRSIAWQGNLTIKDKNGNDVVINTPPSTGMNAGLHRAGQSYGVI